jgi:hypothetical protein
MSNKAILIAITATVIAASGIFILAKSRPADIQTNVSTSSTSSSLNSVIIKNLQSSSLSSVVVSSSVAVSSVTETPKVETPAVVESKPVTQTPAYVAPQPQVVNPKGSQVPVTQPPILPNRYEFNYPLVQLGGVPFSPVDKSFLQENISDVAAYYYNQIKSQYPNQFIYIYAYNISKTDDLNFQINFENTVSPQVAEGATIRSFNQKTFTLTKTSEIDGVFEESLQK